MSVHADPLRNTLDHLALDPEARADRKYLVSMLRRLGYSEAEIRRTLQVDEGEEDRVIEIEYTGSGRPMAETEFEVVQAEEPEEVFEPEFEIAEEPEPMEFEEEPVEFEEEPVEFEEEPVEFEEPEEELVEFVERAEEPEEAEAEWDEEEWTEDEAQEGDDLVGFTVTRGKLDTAPPAHEDFDPAVAAGWKPVEGYERPTAPPGEDEWEEEEAEAAEWTEEVEEGEWEIIDEAPGGWQPADAVEDTVDEAAEVEDWPEAPEAPATDDTWAPKEDSWEPEGGPFRYEDYTLYTRTVELSTGREQRIYFFAKGEPKSGEPAEMPPGYAVEVNEKTGLPFLRRADAPAHPREAPVDHDRCKAITKAGSQCKNSPREGSKFCAPHKGWRGDKVE